MGEASKAIGMFRDGRGEPVVHLAGQSHSLGALQQDPVPDRNRTGSAS